MSITDREPPGWPEPACVSIRMICTRDSRAICCSWPRSAFVMASDDTDRRGAAQARARSRSSRRGLRRSRIALLDPAGQAFVEDLHVSMSREKEDPVGPPGQLVRARSVEDDEVRARDLGQPARELAQEDIAGADDVELVELLGAAHVHE